MKKFEELVQGDILVLVDYFATWCGPCKMMYPVLEELKKQLGDQIKILKVDIDLPANRPVVAAHNVQSVPTLMLFKGGKLLWRQSGVMETAQLREIIGKFL